MSAIEVEADALEETGEWSKRETFGPGIVTRRSDGSWGTLRGHSLQIIPESKVRTHLEWRGSDERDFGAPLINLYCPNLDQAYTLIDPYAYETL